MLEGMRGRRLTGVMRGMRMPGVMLGADLMFAHSCERFGGPCNGAGDLGGAFGRGLRGWPWDELESLILAQNERWRHA